MKQPKTLAEMRALAYAAVADHEADMKNNPAYAAMANKQMAKAEAKAKREGKTADFLGK